jgi:hypothetical protein
VRRSTIGTTGGGHRKLLMIERSRAALAQVVSDR